METHQCFTALLLPLPGIRISSVHFMTNSPKEPQPTSELQGRGPCPDPNAQGQEAHRTTEGALLVHLPLFFRVERRDKLQKKPS